MQNDIAAAAAGPIAANDNNPTINMADVAVFDHDIIRPILDEPGEWSPPRLKRIATVRMRLSGDGPSADHRIRAGVAWYSSHRYRGQHVNDNKDWPLAKLLRAEGNDHCLRIAERYRELYDAANDPVELVGREVGDNIYIMARTDLDESTGELVSKGEKRVTGRRAKLDDPGKQSVAADPDNTKKRAKSIPKRWNGDWPLLNKIDAGRELAVAQAALGPVREAFEAAVVGGETLEAIGRSHGVGNQTGAKGAGRALVYLGLQWLDNFWLRPANRVAA